MGVNMNSMIFLEKCKYTSMYYNNIDFFIDNGYIKVTDICFEVYFDKFTRCTISYLAKKSNNQSCRISFSLDSFLNPEKIEWDIIKSVYFCPMSIKKLMKKNEDLLKNILYQSEKDFKPYFIKMYGC